MDSNDRLCRVAWARDPLLSKWYPAFQGDERAGEQVFLLLPLETDQDQQLRDLLGERRTDREARSSIVDHKLDNMDNEGVRAITWLLPQLSLNMTVLQVLEVWECPCCPSCADSPRRSRSARLKIGGVVVMEKILFLRLRPGFTRL